MYNHYTPQSDGSYRRSSMPDSPRRPAEPQMNLPGNSPEHSAPESAPHRNPPRQQEPQPGILSFLHSLLPREIDTADLTVIFLILLMNREDCGDGFSPLLTLALYFLL